jgi:hypothetical protein
MSTEPKDLLSKLRSIDPTGIHNSLTLYLNPILESGADIDKVDVRGFQSFLNKCFAILGSVLLETPQCEHSESILNELFEA